MKNISKHSPRTSILFCLLVLVLLLRRAGTRGSMTRRLVAAIPGSRLLNVELHANLFTSVVH